MKSNEVSELFLTESMIMGVLGGFFGIILGITAGKLLSLGVTLFAIKAGIGVVNLTYIPISTVLLITFLSFFVGMITGIYPAKRAKNISALNALRYE